MGKIRRSFTLDFQRNKMELVALVHASPLEDDKLYIVGATSNQECCIGPLMPCVKS